MYTPLRPSRMRIAIRENRVVASRLEELRIIRLRFSFTRWRIQRQPFKRSRCRGWKGREVDRSGGGGRGTVFTLIKRFKSQLGSSSPGPVTCPHTRFPYTRTLRPSAHPSRGIQRYKVEYSCVCSNVHLIIKKTVIQARKLGRGAARS